MPAAAIGAVATIGGAVIGSNASKKASQAAQQTASESNATQLQIFNQQRADLAPWRESGTKALAEINRRLGLTSGTAPNTQQPQTQPALGGGASQPQANRGIVSRINAARDEAMMQDDSQIISNALGSLSPQVQPALTTPMVGTGAPTTSTTPTAGGNAPDYSGFYASPGYQFRLNEGTRNINANRATSGMLQSGDTLKALTRYGQDYASNEFNNQLNQLFNVAGLGQTATSQGNVLAGNYANNVTQNNQYASNALQSSYANNANIWGNALGTLGGIAYNQWGQTWGNQKK